MYFSTLSFSIILSFIILTDLKCECVVGKKATFNINTFQVIPLPVPPLHQQLTGIDPVTIVNNGNGVDLFINPACKNNYIRGGILGPNDVYIGYQICYNFNASIHGTSGLTFNGIGTPLVVDSFWYNSKYGSALNAVTHPDGIVVIRDSVRIGFQNNYFPAFEGVLNEIQKVGSQANSFFAVGFSFFLPTNIRKYYYSYKGYFANAIKNLPVKCNSATVLVTPLIYSQSISPNQFRAFQRLLIGGPISAETSPELFKKSKTPVYCANGAININYA